MAEEDIQTKWFESLFSHGSRTAAHSKLLWRVKQPKEVCLDAEPLTKVSQILEEVHESVLPMATRLHFTNTNVTRRQKIGKIMRSVIEKLSHVSAPMRILKKTSDESEIELSDAIVDGSGVMAWSHVIEAKPIPGDTKSEAITKDSSVLSKEAAVNESHTHPPECDVLLKNETRKMRFVSGVVQREIARNYFFRTSNIYQL